MMYSTSQNNAFRHVTGNISVINMNLVRLRGIDEVGILKIRKLQKLRLYFFDMIEMTDDRNEIKRLSDIVTQINFQLQKLWGFPLDASKHRWFDIPKCSCKQFNAINSILNPNEENWIYKKDCIVHGY